MSSFRHAFRKTFRTGRHRNDTPHYDFLLPEVVVAPRDRSARARPDVVDAHFVTLPKPQPAASASRIARTGMAGLVLDRVERALRRLPNDAYSAVVAATAVGVFIICGGFSIMPGMAQGRTDLPLALTHITVTPQDAGGMRILLVNGIVENRGDRPKNLQAIRAEIFSDGQLVASTLITPPVELIDADRSHGFAARLRHPGGKDPDVRLSIEDAGVSRS